MNALYEVAPFLESVDSMALRTWVEEGTVREAQLIAGQAGCGKTRLALHFGRYATAHGWLVLLATNSADLEPWEPVAVATGDATPTGIVILVDYADRWPQEDLQQLMTRTAGWAGKVRLLLVSRSEAFWPPASDSLRKLGFEVRSRRLSGPHSSTGDASVMYRLAHEAYAAALGVEVGDDMADSVAGVTHTLSVHIKALLDALQAADPEFVAPAAAATWDELSASLLDRELAHWTRMAKHATPPVRSPHETLFRCALVAILLRGQNHEQAQAVLTFLGFDRRDELLADHARLYPAPRRDQLLWPLLPDRLGEDVVARSLTTAPDDRQLSGWGGPACDSLLGKLLTWQTMHDVDGTTVAIPKTDLRSAFAVLADAGERWPHVQQLLVAAMSSNPLLSVVAGGGVIARLASGFSFDALQQIADEMGALTVFGTNLELHDGQIQIRRRLCSDEKFAALPAKTRANHMVSLGSLLGAVGNLRDAAALTGEAANLVLQQGVGIDNEDVVVADGVDEAWAATILVNHAHHLSALERTGEALAYSGIGVKLAQQWVAKCGDEGVEIHIAALNAYATALDGVGRTEEALDLEKRLLSYQTRDFAVLDHHGRAAVSATMNNLGGRLRRAGQKEEGLILIRQAFTISYKLATEFPPVYMPLLLKTMHNMAQVFYDDGDFLEAVDFAEWVVEKRRKLIEHVDDGYVEPLMRSLHLLRAIYAKLERWDDACTISAEYVAMLRAVAGWEERGQQSLEEHIQLLMVVREHGDEVASAGMVGRSVAVLGRDGLALLSPYSLLFVASEMVRAKLPFEVIAPAVSKLARVLSPLSAEATEILDLDRLKIVPGMLGTWADQANIDRPEEPATVVSVVLDALSFLRVAVTFGVECASEVAALCNNATVYAAMMSGPVDMIDVARLAVQAAELAAESGSDNDSDRLAVLTTLAVSIVTGEGDRHLDEALRAVTEAVAIAERQVEARHTVVAGSNLAMCLEAAAGVHSAAGRHQEAFETSLAALGHRAGCVLAAGRRSVPDLSHSWQQFESHARAAGQEAAVPRIRTQILQALPSEAQRDLDIPNPMT